MLRKYCNTQDNPNNRAIRQVSGTFVRRITIRKYCIIMLEYICIKKILAFFAISLFFRLFHGSLSLFVLCRNKYDVATFATCFTFYLCIHVSIHYTYNLSIKIFVSNFSRHSMYTQKSVRCSENFFFGNWYILSEAVPYINIFRISAEYLSRFNYALALYSVKAKLIK